MDWSSCEAVERVPGRVSGQWIVKGTRILADGVLENADAGYTPEQLASEIYEGLTVDTARDILSYATQQRRARLQSWNLTGPSSFGVLTDLSKETAKPGAFVCRSAIAGPGRAVRGSGSRSAGRRRS